MCDEFAFRGEGVAYVDADAVADTWACIYLGGDADDFAQVGDVTCTLDSVDLAVQLTPAPWSDGCEITCTSWEMAP
jgi:hypothetical protein